MKACGHRGGWNAGILLVLVGGLLLVHNLDLVGDLWEYWPVILIAIGVVKLVEHDNRTEARR